MAVRRAPNKRVALDRKGRSRRGSRHAPRPSALSRISTRVAVPDRAVPDPLVRAELHRGAGGRVVAGGADDARPDAVAESHLLQQAADECRAGRRPGGVGDAGCDPGRAAGLDPVLWHRAVRGVAGIGHVPGPARRAAAAAGFSLQPDAADHDLGRRHVVSWRPRRRGAGHCPLLPQEQACDAVGRRHDCVRGADRIVLWPPRQLHQRRIVGQANRRVLGDGVLHGLDQARDARVSGRHDAAPSEPAL